MGSGSRDCDDKWRKLAIIEFTPVPIPLQKVLRIPGGRWLRTYGLDTDFQQMPPLDMSRCIEAFASLGRCSVAVGLYMAGAIRQLHHGEKDVRITRTEGEVTLYGRLEAGYFHLLNDTFVVPHQFNCRWRIAHQPCPLTAISRREMPPIQSLGVDGDGIIPAVEPPPTLIQLLPHQQRSFRWMVHREAVRDLFVCESGVTRPTPVPLVELEWRMDKAFDLRGGVLCDPVGSGKTATVLCLVQHDGRASDWTYEGEDAARELFADSWLTADATLVLCPDHVHEQWLREIDKVLPQGALEVVPVRSVQELRAAAPHLKRLAEAAAGTQPVLVVVALSVLGSVEYQELVSPANKELKGWLQGQVAWRQGLALDCLIWRRLVVDEVHEAVHICSDACCKVPCPQAALLKHLRAIKSERRWGLTGTAQEVLRDARAVQCLAQVFRADFNSEASARRFVEHYCRTNQVTLPVPITERREVIQQSVFERVLYKQRARDLLALGLDGTGEQPLSEQELLAVVPLLKLCSHFAIGEGDQSESPHQASEAAQAMLAVKQQAAEVARAEVDALAEAEAKCLAHEDTKSPADDVVVSAAMLAPELWAKPQVVEGEPVVVITKIEATGTVLCPRLHVGDTVTALGGAPMFDFAMRFLLLEKDLEAQMKRRGPPSDVLRAELQDLEVRQKLAEAFQKEIMARAKSHGTVSIAWRQTGVVKVQEVSLGPRVASSRSLASKHRTWREAEASFSFLQRIWNSLCSNDRMVTECPICFDTFDSARTGVVLRCAHMYCNSCGKRLFGSAKRGRCPICRLQVASAQDVLKLEEFAHCRELYRTASQGESRHGSKLQRMAEVLREVLAAAAENRAIIFCQFADLEVQISDALHSFGIQHGRLSAARDIFEQTALLDSFQERRGHSRVLLLSLEQSASGTNLTVANHVFLVHPMAASTPERAVAFEQQAVGRCVRLGQSREVVVWRFVTQGTVEEVLDDRLASRRKALDDKGAPSGKAGTNAPKEIVDAFKRLDFNGNGFIDQSDLKEVFRRLEGPNWTQEQVDQLMAAADTDHDGRLDLEDFLHWIFEGGSEQEELLGLVASPSARRARRSFRPKAKSKARARSGNSPARSTSPSGRSPPARAGSFRR